MESLIQPTTTTALTSSIPLPEEKQYDLYFPEVNADKKTTEQQQRILKKQLKTIALPYWLTHPIFISPVLDQHLQDSPKLEQSHHLNNLLGLSSSLIQTCFEVGQLTSWFPVQETIIPLILNHPHQLQRDLLVSAPTGSGKTLAYVLPIIQKLSKCSIKRLRAIVIVPTRELVTQVAEVFTLYAQGTSLKIGQMAGNVSLLQPTKQTLSTTTDNQTNKGTMSSSKDDEENTELNHDVLTTEDNEEKDQEDDDEDKQFEETLMEVDDSSFIEDTNENENELDLKEEKVVDMSSILDTEKKKSSMNEKDSSNHEVVDPLIASSSSQRRTWKQEQSYFALPYEPSSFLKQTLKQFIPSHHPSSQLLHSLFTPPHLTGGHSNVDILITTPARLLDHLHSTPNFSLQHVEFLVLDEADRLLEGPAGDWMTPLLEALTLPSLSALKSSPTSNFASFTPLLQKPKFGYPSRPLTHRPMKLLFSATLTRNPEKLGLLHLHHPLHIATKHTTNEPNPVPSSSSSSSSSSFQLSSQFNLEMISKYVLPKTLKEYMMITPSLLEKPLALAHLLRSPFWSPDTFSSTTTTCISPQYLIFTRSTESAHRLTQVLTSLLQFPPIDIQCASFTGDLPQHQRDLLLHKYKQKQVQVLVSSDVIARGLDVEVNVVLNYDHPNFYSQYVHRVGRTARAGKQGIAISLLASHEIKFFKEMVKEKRGEFNIELMKYKATKEEKDQLNSILYSES